MCEIQYDLHLKRIASEMRCAHFLYTYIRYTCLLFLHIDRHIYKIHISCVYWFSYTYNCHIYTWLEDDEEDFVEDRNHICEDDDFVNIDDKEEEWTNFAIFCYFDLKLFYFGSINLMMNLVALSIKCLLIYNVTVFYIIYHLYMYIYCFDEFAHCVLCLCSKGPLHSIVPIVC